MNFLKLSSLVILITLSSIGSIHAQSSCNADGWVLPCNKNNTRFTNDYFDIPRPALSLRGFDNTFQDNYDHSQDEKVYGVRQLLEKLYGIGSPVADSYALELIFYMRKVNEQAQFKSDDNNNREFNGRLLETKAFLTLISFIIEENQGSGGKLNGLGNLSLPSHNTLRNEI